MLHDEAPGLIKQMGGEIKLLYVIILSLSLSITPVRETHPVVTAYNGGNVITVVDSKGNTKETDDWFLIDDEEVIF